MRDPFKRSHRRLKLRETRPCLSTQLSIDLFTFINLNWWGWSGNRKKLSFETYFIKYGC
jgi:hypothetical protein